MLDFADAPPPMSFDIIPDKTLAWVRVHVRPVNLHSNQILTQNKSGSQSLDLELEIVGGPFGGRKLWDMIIATHPENKGVQMGQAAFKAILESNGTANPQDKRSYAVPGYMAFDGMMAAVEIGLQAAEEYTDRITGQVKPGKEKNRVSQWLTPHADSTVQKFQALVAAVGGRHQGGKEAPAGFGQQANYQAAPPANDPRFNAPPAQDPYQGGQYDQGPQQPQQGYQQPQQYGQPAPGFQPAQQAGGGPANWGPPGR